LELLLEKVSIAVPYHGNRVAWANELIASVADDPTVEEIVYSAEPGSNTSFTRHLKVKIKKLSRKHFVFKNKISAMKMASCETVILLDSDNLITTKYIDCAIKDSESNMIRCPVMGSPYLDYRSYAGDKIDLQKAILHIKNNTKAFDCLLNTMNWVCNRDFFLESVSMFEEYDPFIADSMFINYCLLKNGGYLYIDKDLEYGHRVHKGSTWKINAGRGKESIASVKKLFMENNDASNERSS
jgi:hypothetical protein